MPSAPAIGFEYRPSRVLRRACFVVASLTLLAITLSALPWWAKAVAMAMVWVAIWRAWAGLTDAPVVAAGWSKDNQWTLRLASAEEVAATLSSFRVLGTFVLLSLHAPALGKQTLLLGPDNSDADLRRRLRMRLATVQAEEALPRI